MHYLAKLSRLTLSDTLPTARTHAARSSPRPARALKMVVFMHSLSMASSRATAGTAGGYKAHIFYAFSCAFMHFFSVAKKELSLKNALNERLYQKLL
jgi:hypothetical protein